MPLFAHHVEAASAWDRRRLAGDFGERAYGPQQLGPCRLSKNNRYLRESKPCCGSQSRAPRLELTNRRTDSNFFQFRRLRLEFSRASDRF